MCLFLLLIPRSPRSTLFPYTTLFRSLPEHDQTFLRSSDRARSNRKKPSDRNQSSRSEAQNTLSHLRRSEEHTSELQSQFHLVCRLLLEKKKATSAVSSDVPHSRIRTT